jgi:hypothetical protein
MGQYSTYSNNGASESTSQTEGGIKSINVTDQNSAQLLGDILKELKKLNLHMSIVTDLTINSSEVE